MKDRVRLVLTACALLSALVLLASACSKAREAAAHGTSETQALSASPADCGHAVCADNFFIDAVPASCTAGSPCSATLKLVATGDFHVNDEYPYRFKADDASGVAFLGTDSNGTNTFSKSAGDWAKTDPKSGAMTLKFIAADPGAKAIGGTLKLSVCSAQACLLEQRQVTASVLTK
jgi:hypothetical protein